MVLPNQRFQPTAPLRSAPVSAGVRWRETLDEPDTKLRVEIARGIYFSTFGGLAILLPIIVYADEPLSLIAGVLLILLLMVTVVFYVTVQSAMSVRELDELNRGVESTTSKIPQVPFSRTTFAILVLGAVAYFLKNGAT